VTSHFIFDSLLTKKNGIYVKSIGFIFRELCASKRDSVFYLEYQKDVHRKKSMSPSEQVCGLIVNTAFVVCFGSVAPRRSANALLIRPTEATQ
jgi:hypothetical protein